MIMGSRALHLAVLFDSPFSHIYLFNYLCQYELMAVHFLLQVEIPYHCYYFDAEIVPAFVFITF